MNATVVRWGVLVVILVVGIVLLAGMTAGPRSLQVGSKKFTEGVVLGEVLKLLVRNAGQPCGHEAELGGTRIVFDALVAGEIDAYVEYTGTLQREILAKHGRRSLAAMREALEAQGVRMGPTLGFNNTYDLGMLRTRAEALGIRTISDLREHAGLMLGFTHEFIERDDGWRSLQQRYGLPQQDVTGLEHNIAYRAIDSGDIDVMEVYSTDAMIEIHDMIVLKDDLDFFPTYEAVILYRSALETSNPGVVEAFERVRDRISEAEMTRMNFAVDGEERKEAVVAAEFLQKSLGVFVAADVETRAERLVRLTYEQILLVGVSLLIAVVLGLGLGILAAKTGGLGQVIVGVVGAAQTFPGIALLALLVPWLGIGWEPAVFALVVYSLLPIVRNTHAGLVSIPRPLQESAEVLELGPARRMFAVELPLALPGILAGIKTAAVWNVGLATLGALVGAGGYGESILSGLRKMEPDLILEGAVPAILMALLLQYLFEALERKTVTRGLRPEGS